MQNIPRWKKSDRGSCHFRHGLDPRLKSAVVDTQRKLSDNLKAVNDSEVIRNKLKTTYYKRYRRERRQL